MSDAYARLLSPEALGGATDEQFQWALSLVHMCGGLGILTHTSPHPHSSSLFPPHLMCVYSHTFDNNAPGGGVGVHMLVPFVDTLYNSSPPHFLCACIYTAVHLAMLPLAVAWACACWYR